MEVFKDYAYYYNIFYQDKDYVSEANCIDLLMKKYGDNISKIINYGCGTGRHDIELTKIGYKCNGIDLSPLMIKIAEENSKKENVVIDFEIADVRSYMPDGKYDAVVSLFHVMSYQNTNEDIISTFRSARKALNLGGLFLFDVWYGPGVLSDKPQVRVKEIENDKYKLIRIATPVMYDKTNIVEVSYEIYIVDRESKAIKIINEKHNMRYFFRPELEFYLAEAGFKLIDNLDCTTLKETSYDSWTSYFMAEAI